MLDIGWSEMAMIALLALIVIGPKDLPRVMRSAGQWMRKARKMARDFQNSLDDMIEDEELREAKQSVETEARRFNKRDAFNIGETLEKHVDPDGSLREHASEIDTQARSTEREVNAGDAGHAPSDGDGSAAGKLASPGGADTDSASESGAPPSSGDAAGVQRETPVAPGNSVNAAPPSRERDEDAEPETAGAGRPAGPRDS